METPAGARPALIERVTKPHTLEDRTRCRRCLSGPSPGGDDDPTHKPGLKGSNDARTGMPPGMPGGAMCVQRLDDSLNSAIHITYRSSLRSSSMPEPRDPLLKVLTKFSFRLRLITTGMKFSGLRRLAPERAPRRSNSVRYSRVGGWAPGGSPHSVMILPQVHLRKPCYDFYFL